MKKTLVSFVSLVLASSLFLGACEKKQPEPVATPEPEAAPVEEAVPAEAMAPDLQLPEPKEITYTAEDKLGTLSENVGVAVGTQIADFELAGSDGVSVKLSDLVAKAPTVVFFYRGGWCPYCNFQVREFQTNQAAFAEAGIQVVGISVDRPESGVAMKGAYQLTYPVLSDPDLAAHKAFNVAFTPDAETLEAYKGYGIDLQAWSGRDHNTIAVPGIFLVDGTSTVRWAHADLDYKVRPSATAVLSAAKTVLGIPSAEPVQQ